MPVRWVRRVKKTVRGTVFSGARIGAEWRREQQMCVGRADCLQNGGGFVVAEVVHHHQIAGSQRRRQNAFDSRTHSTPKRIRRQNAIDLCAEDVAVHGTIKHPGCIDPVVAQGSDEGGGVPVPEGSCACGVRITLSFACWEPIWKGCVDECGR